MTTFSSTGIYRPNYVFAETVGYLTKVVSFESGKEVRHSKGSPRREFTLVYSNTDDTTKDAIVDFLKARESSYESFTWTNPNDSVVYTVRLKEESITVDTIDYGTHNITVDFLEIV